MSDHRAYPADGSTLRGKLLRSGRIWPMPINDTLSYWTVCDDLFPGDRLILPKTKQFRDIRLSVVCKPNYTQIFRETVSCHSRNHWLSVLAECPKCEVEGSFDITVDSIQDGDDAVFSRYCSCGHAFQQKATLVAWYR